MGTRGDTGRYDLAGAAAADRTHREVGRSAVSFLRRLLWHNHEPEMTAIADREARVEQELERAEQAMVRARAVLNAQVQLMRHDDARN